MNQNINIQRVSYNIGSFKYSGIYNKIDVKELNTNTNIFELILLNVPIPALYIVKQQNSLISLIVSGTSIYEFIDKFLNSNHKLVNLKFFPEYEQKRFCDIEKKTKEKIYNTPLDVILINVNKKFSIHNIKLISDVLTTF